MDLSNVLASYLRFFRAGLVQHAQTGAIFPSQRFLIDKMLAPIPPTYDGEVLELGAGTGVLTSGLPPRCPSARVVSCEINPALARDAENHLASLGIGQNVQVLCGSAQSYLAQRIRESSPPLNFVISGIPLGNVGKEKTLALINAIRECLREGGLYIQFQHSLLDRKKIRAQFPELRTVPVLLNFPPAFVYYARKRG